MKTVKGYKVFKSDWTCRGFQYEVGQTYRLPKGVRPVLCRQGFHFCRKPADCFDYMPFSPSSKCAEIEARGTVLGKGSKSVCSVIRIVRELTWHEMLELCNAGVANTGRSNDGDFNTGDANLGDHNTGDRNSGNYNSNDDNVGDYNAGNDNVGDFNSGDGNLGCFNVGNMNIGNNNVGGLNVGDYNTGSDNHGSFNTGDFNEGKGNVGKWNAGNYNVGFFNTGEPPVRIFNKVFEGDYACIEFPAFFEHVEVCTWVPWEDMSPEERAFRPKHTECGIVRSVPYKEAWRTAFEHARNDSHWRMEKKRLLSLPNFDFKVFEEITGITRQDIMGRRKRQ